MSTDASAPRTTPVMPTSIAEPGGRENTPHRGRALLVLDFDGVLCDSLPECYVSSLLAHRRQPPGTHPPIDPAGDYGRFAVLRPFVRSGEDYLLIHETIERGIEVSDQHIFDALIAAAGSAGMRDRKRRLYETRERLLAAEPVYWLGLNPAYPHLAAVLPRIAPHPDVHILSTKRSDLVGRILASWGLAFPANRVHEPRERTKIEIIGDLLRREGAAHAVFVDDQADYFRGAAGSPEVTCHLAAWGYVARGAVAPSPDYAVLREDDAPALFLRWAVPA